MAGYTDAWERRLRRRDARGREASCGHNACLIEGTVGIRLASMAKEATTAKSEAFSPRVEHKAGGHTQAWAHSGPYVDEKNMREESAAKAWR